jgi:hypothetical protein
MPNRSPHEEGEGWWRRRESNYCRVLKTRKLLKIKSARTYQNASLTALSYKNRYSGQAGGRVLIAHLFDNPSRIKEGLRKKYISLQVFWDRGFRFDTVAWTQPW